MGAAEFAARMEALGPWPEPLRLALAVSGGADSLALAWLTRRWAAARGADLLAFVVDHGLRAESAEEARFALAELAALGIPARLLVLSGLAPGPGKLARAREARYRALFTALREAGCVYLLLGHHLHDQAETLLMRAARGSGPLGRAGMAGRRAMAGVMVLRPLLDIPPARLRATLRAAGRSWIEDPSNADPATERARLRPLLAAPARAAGLAAAVQEAGEEAERSAAAIAEELAERVSLFAEGFALIRERRLSPSTLAALIQIIGGALHPPPRRQVAGLADALRPATLAGTRLLPAGRWGEGVLLVREAAAMAPPLPARPGAWWDRRFRLSFIADAEEGWEIGALGAEAARFRRLSPLPAAVLATLPALRRGEELLVPSLGWPDAERAGRFPLTFAPPRPAWSARFGEGGGCRTGQLSLCLCRKPA